MNRRGVDANHGTRKDLTSELQSAARGKRRLIPFGLLLALPLLALWSWPSPPPPVRVIFQHATNDPGNGRVGLIEIVNYLNETVTIMGAWHVPAKRKELSISKDTQIATVYHDAWGLNGRSTTIVEVSLPTNGGPYRLVLQCMPDSKNPWRSQRTLRYRIANFVYPWLHPSQTTVVRWVGGSIVASQAIDVNQ